MSVLSSMIKRYKSTNLIIKIMIGIVVGVFVGICIPSFTDYTSLLGDFFIGALKAIAPILVFILVLSAISTREYGNGTKKIKQVIILYLIGTFLASVCGVVASFLFPTKLILEIPNNIDLTPPSSVAMVFKDLLFKMIENPVSALANGNYIGILTWAIAAGIALKTCSKEVKKVFIDINEGTIKIVAFIVRLAPIGIFGLVSTSVAKTGVETLADYVLLLLVLVGTMLFVTFVINPLIVFVVTKKNPYPLVWVCIKHSAIYAFFTRSSAANIPVNMALCSKINVDKELYGVSIPLGATINMAGAAVTISVLALAAVHTLGLNITFTNAILLSFLAAFAACGASGVAGGSLLLVPLACSLFGINDDIAMQVVGVGFIIGVIQDSVETALNSSTDVLFSAICSDTKIDLSRV
ncbi:MULTISPECIES: serine/threonine transporter SstT [unclassified Campylobacter]|uniref:serine/threonine transporter SstT n=1 Tax=unclassified Campylobacter TaxID=2593542 RepID=UPI001BDAF107|nr:MULTISPECIES: serine/threonine transporter SstT [unclassified Campylobacter]MBZ7976313.1 serine/threonine transporter SstT [Campylobacter sp. RM12637]MBZ7979610.1 serine/threonine transporter SstT [Campylobacter sp. RM12642]MBZ7991354.1 serine/threonine transporter SstT [Campylobacter sp. RM9331]MBZ8005423.1 serine/threonine transporter SstT [Campylobacter sp. RM9332]MBZ8007364.1 serine/threonine transporter SstT [Campylobacter sp. RM9334]